MQQQRKSYDFSPEEISNLRKGIDLQREYFKRANIENEHDIMLKAIENIKSEIKHKAIAKGKSNEILRINKIILWCKTLDQQCTKNTPSGLQIKYPPHIEQKISNNLQIAYELIIELLSILDLI